MIAPPAFLLRPAQALRRGLESPAGFRAVLILYGAILAFGLKRFLVWDQVLRLEGATVSQVVLDDNAHALRYAVMQPAIAWGRLGLDPHAAFTACGFLCVFASALLLAETAGRCLRVDGALWRTAALLALAVPSLGMNGRLLPAFLGLALVLALHVRWWRGDRPGDRHLGWLVAGQALAVLLASVSSGTMAVVTLAVLGFWLEEAFAGREFTAGRQARAYVLLSCGGVILVGFIARYGSKYVAKALQFFGGDPWQVLGHGPGAQVLELRDHLTVLAGPVAASLAAGAVLVIYASTLAWWVARGRRCARVGIALRLPLALALVLGVCGWATLTMALPVLVVLGIVLAAEPGADGCSTG